MSCIEQLLVQGRQRLSGVDPATGEELWGVIAISKALQCEAELRALLMKIALGPFLPGLRLDFARLALALGEHVLSSGGQLSGAADEYCEALATLSREDLEEELRSAAQAGGALTNLLAGTRSEVELFGENEFDAALRSLNVDFQKYAQRLADGIDELTDKLVGVLCALFDAEVANQDEYRAAIADVLGLYNAEVQPIGRSGGLLRPWSLRLFRGDLRG